MPTPRSTPTGSIRDTVSRRRSSDDSRGLCGRFVGAAACVHRVDELDAIRVDDAEHGRGGPEDFGPRLTGPEEAKEPGALRKSRQQWTIIFREPAIEGTVAHAFERMQEPERHDCSRLQGGVGMFGNAVQMRIDSTE